MRIYNKICICGAGHQGMAMAAHLALNGERIMLWNRTPEHIANIKKSRSIHCDGIISGTAKLEKVSSDIGEVFSDFIMVTVPSNAHMDIARKIAPYVSSKTIIILNPGRTFGAIEFVRELERCGVKEIPHIAETQTIVYTCRKKNNNTSTIFALKKDVRIASLNKTDIQYIMDNMPKCLQGYFRNEDTVAKTSFSNVGMILHCAPVLMNVGWIENEKVDFKYYYDGISKSIARFLEKMDNERVSVAKKLGYEIENTEEWMKRTYQVNGKGIFECIKNNIAYKEIDAPQALQNSRYIFEDIPDGLVPIEFLGKQLAVKTPYITLIIDLANAMMETDFRLKGRTIPLNVLKQFF